MSFTKRIPAVVRFWPKVQKRGADECWPWTAATTGDGYGVFYDGARNVSAHRFAFIAAGGEVAPNEDVCHTCDNPPCCNPKHHFAGTRSANMKDCYAKGRHIRFHALKTHCPMGHPYDEANTRINKGRRVCRSCTRMQRRHARRAS